MADRYEDRYRNRRYNRGDYDYDYDYDYDRTNRENYYGRQYQPGYESRDYDRDYYGGYERYGYRYPETERYGDRYDYEDYRYENRPRYRIRYYDRFPDYDRGDYNEPTWTYAEYWWVPGPFSGLGPEGYQRSDQQIMEDVCERLTQHGQLDARDIHVDVNNGEVTLKGTVDNRRAKRMAEDTAESVAGVYDIHNELKIERNQGQRQGMEQREGTQQGT